MDKTRPKAEQEELRSLQMPVEIRAQADGKKKIVGYAVKWEQLSDPIWGMFQEKFQKGAFLNCLRNKPDIIADWQHDFAEIMGRTPDTLVVEEDDIGLRYEIDPPSWAERYIESIERGDVKGSSFIFTARKQEWDETNPDMVIRTIMEADLMEVAPVTFPAYPQSEASTRSIKDAYEEYRASRQPPPPQPPKQDPELWSLRRKINGF